MEHEWWSTENECSCKKVFVKLQQQKGGAFFALKKINNDETLLY